jgi:protein-S-isoprenylcysteine O-methyltransferase Ste14
MLRRWAAIVIGVPTLLIVIPGLLLLLFRKTRYSHSVAPPSKPRLWLASLLGLAGVVLTMRTMSLFVRFGEGTAAPWDPPRRFVVRGPYRYVRNPMMTGFFLILFAEFLFLWSWPLLVWTAVVIIVNLIYMPLFEEKGLEKRFGDEYLAYKRHVPRWIPRLTPWRPNTGRE